MSYYLIDPENNYYMYEVDSSIDGRTTTVKPPDDMVFPIWDGSKWTEKIEEPSLEQKLQAKQTVLIAGLAKDVKTLQGAVKTLVMQNAMNSKEEK